MASFPTLQTEAIAQYPLTTQVQFATNVVRFMDGSEQRFPVFSTPLRQWTIRLDLLDEGELNATLQFFRAQSGGTGIFSFTDPADGTVYPSCRFVSDSIQTSMDAAGRGATAIVVQQNRS
jgi:hypothetical protein